MLDCLLKETIVKKFVYMATASNRAVVGIMMVPQLPARQLRPVRKQAWIPKSKFSCLAAAVANADRFPLAPTPVTQKAKSKNSPLLAPLQWGPTAWPSPQQHNGIRSPKCENREDERSDTKKRDPRKCQRTMMPRAVPGTARSDHASLGTIPKHSHPCRKVRICLL